MSLAIKISQRNRDNKWRLFLNNIKPMAQTTILDAGFCDQEYSPGDNYLEKKYQYPQNITALSIEPARRFMKKYPQVKCVIYDGARFPFADQQFDVCWSNAVLEHVGSRRQQIDFLREIKRVAGRAFITTPNKYFPIEVHTRTFLFHLLPKKFFHWYLRLVGQNWAAGDYMNLLCKKDLKRILTAAGIENYRLIENKIFFFTLDYVIIF